METYAIFAALFIAIFLLTCLRRLCCASTDYCKFGIRCHNYNCIKSHPEGRTLCCFGFACTKQKTGECKANHPRSYKPKAKPSLKTKDVPVLHGTLADVVKEADKPKECKHGVACKFLADNKCRLLHIEEAAPAKS